MGYHLHVLFQIVILATQLTLICAVVAYILWGIARGISGYTDVPFIATPRRILPLIAEALDIRLGDVVYDLGCGDGRFLFYCAKRFPDARFVGVERNSLLVWFIRLKKFLLRTENMSVRRENMLDADISDATHVYVFLLPEIMAALSAKLISVHVVSRAFPIPNRREERIMQLPKKPDAWNTHVLYVYSL